MPRYRSFLRCFGYKKRLFIYSICRSKKNNFYLYVIFYYIEGKYKITVFTGDKRNAGTDADVSIELYGSLGNSGDIKLDNQENNFERGK